MKKDYYKVLGLPSNASTHGVKQAFRNLALQFHPDRHVHASKYVKEIAIHRFKELSEAYEVLSNERKRAMYHKGGGSSHSTTSTSHKCDTSSLCFESNHNLVLHLFGLNFFIFLPHEI
jgi:DnaJ-class molecular chaperone